MTMSMLQATNAYQNQAKASRRNDFGFVAILICMALGLSVFAVIFTPAPIGSGVSADTLYVGP